METLIKGRMREIILFIAYRACSGKNFVWKENPFQYRNATNLIAIVFVIHIAQIFFTIGNNDFISIKLSNGLIYAGLIFCGVALLYLSEKIFSKRVLARSIKLYKESFLSRYAKPIAYTYFCLNILILIGILIYL